MFNPEILEPTIKKKKTQKGEGKEKKDLETLKLEGEKIYLDEFTGKLNEILNNEFTVGDKEEKIILKNVIDKYLREFSDSKFSDLSTTQQAEIQKRFVSDLAGQISKIPSDPWAIDFERAIRTGKLNCTACASLNGLVLESAKEKIGLRNVEFGCPYGHAMNIVTFSDDRFYYVDSRNNIFDDLTDNAEIEEQNGLKIYKIKQPIEGKGYKIIPVSSVKDGVLNSYLDNLTSAYQPDGEDIPDVLEKTRTPEQIEEFKKEGKKICQEKNLSEEKHQHLADIREIFGGKIDEYENSVEFQDEIKRWEKVLDLRAGKGQESETGKGKTEKEFEKK